MKKKTLLSKIMQSRGAALVATVAMIAQTVFPSMAIAANELGSYDEFQLTVSAPVISYNGDGTFDVSLFGTGEASPFVWPSASYYVRMDWADGNVALSDTPSTSVLDTFHTPDLNVSLAGNWSGEHTFTAPGTYNVVVEWMFNPDQPHNADADSPEELNLGNDGIRARITVPIVLELPSQSTDENATICVDEEGYHVTITGTESLSPFVWPSMAYYVRADWDDGDTEYSDTVGSNVTDSLITPDLNVSLTGDWNGEHLYAAEGEYDVVVDLFFNPDQPHNGDAPGPQEMNLDNDVLKNSTTLHINTDDAVPCNPPDDQDQDNSEEPIEVFEITGSVVDACTDGEVYQATLTGTGNGTPFTWPTMAYYVNLDWMDTSTSNSDTPDSGATDHFITPDLNVSIAGTWNAEHEYAEPGVYSVEVKMLYNPDQPHASPVVIPAESNTSNDIIKALTTVTVTVSEDAPACEPVVEELGEGTVTIEKVWSFVSATPTYPSFGIALDGSDVGITAATSVSDVMTVTEGTHTITETVEGFDTSITCAVDNGEGSDPIDVTDGSFVVDEDEDVSCIVTNTEQSGENGGGGDGEGDGGGDGPVTNSLGEPNIGGNTLITLGAGNLTGNNPAAGGGNPEGDVLGVQDTDETLLTCADQYPEAALITGELDDLLAAYGFTRNTGLESTLGGALVPKILVPGAPLGSEQILQNFIVYGIQALLELGAGERAGIVATFVNLYGVLPENECDWQNVIRIGQGVVPVVKSSERELLVEGVFEEIYDRAPVREVAQDNVTVLIMTYGLRPDVRSLQAEIQAANIFKGIFGHVPQNTGEWDIMRGIAYGGITVPGYSPIVR